MQNQQCLCIHDNTYQQLCTKPFLMENKRLNMLFYPLVPIIYHPSFMFLPIGSVSEEAQESRNKDCKYYKTHDTFGSCITPQQENISPNYKRKRFSCYDRTVASKFFFFFSIHTTFSKENFLPYTNTKYFKRNIPQRMFFVNSSTNQDWPQEEVRDEIGVDFRRPQVQAGQRHFFFRYHYFQNWKQ